MTTRHGTGDAGIHASDASLPAGSHAHRTPHDVAHGPHHGDHESADHDGHSHRHGDAGAHGHSHGHVHGLGGHGAASARGTSSQRRRLLIATVMNIVIVVGQTVAGLTAGSVGLLADAGHNLSDTAGVVLALIALQLSRRPPSASRTFGGVRWPVLAAQANSAAVLVVTAILIVEAVGRLGDAGPVNGLVVVAVALVAAIGNGVSALVVHDRHGDLNTRAAVLHLASDAAVSVAVAAAGLVIWLADGWYWLDPAVSLVIAVLIAAQGARLLASASRVLLEATPASTDVAAVRADILADGHVLDVHDLHIWSLSDRVLAASVHLELGHLDTDGAVGDGHPDLAQARAVSDGIKAMLAARHGITHVTIEAECEPCTPPHAHPCEIIRGLNLEPRPADLDKQRVSR